MTLRIIWGGGFYKKTFCKVQAHYVETTSPARTSKSQAPTEAPNPEGMRREQLPKSRGGEGCVEKRVPSQELRPSGDASPGHPVRESGKNTYCLLRPQLQLSGSPLTNIQRARKLEDLAFTSQPLGMEQGREGWAAGLEGSAGRARALTQPSSGLVSDPGIHCSVVDYSESFEEIDETVYEWQMWGTGFWTLGGLSVKYKMRRIRHVIPLWQGTQHLGLHCRTTPVMNETHGSDSPLTKN